MNSEYGVTPEKPSESGYYTVRCPVCGWMFQRMTEHGVMQVLTDHMNAQHADEPGSGHA